MHARVHRGQKLGILLVRKQRIHKPGNVIRQCTQIQRACTAHKLAASRSPSFRIETRRDAMGFVFQLAVMLVHACRRRIQDSADNDISQTQDLGTHFLVVALTEGEGGRIGGRDGHGGCRV